MSVPIRTALVGCGSLGRVVHLPILTRLPGVRVVAIADADPASLAAAGALAAGAAAFGHHQELLTRAEADAVVIALPTSLCATASLRAGARRNGACGARARRSSP